MRIDAVVLAGGEASAVDSSLEGPKSLIDIAGKPMISYVMEALASCQDLENTVIAVPEGDHFDRFRDFSDLIVTNAGGVIDSIAEAIEVVGKDGYILVVSSDMPMLSTRAIDDFLISCKKTDAEIYYSIISKESTDAVFPGARRTYMGLREGKFTGGNVHLTSKEAFLRNQDIGARMFNLRKNPLAMLRLLGLGFVIKYFTGRLGITTLEEKAGDLLNAKLKAIVTSYPELGIDVDKPEDLKLAEDFLTKAINH